MTTGSQSKRRLDRWSPAWRVHCLVVIAAARLWVAPASADTRPPTEYEMKAVFIYNFAKYIQWPGLATPETEKPFVVGLIGKDPFGPVLDDVMRGQRVQNRAVVVRRFATVHEVVNCDILFVGSSEQANLQRIFEALRRAPVLTVGDMDHFAERGGMINLTTEENRIRFEINMEAIGRSGLKAGSQLLRLARLVTESRSGER